MEDSHYFFQTMLPLHFLLTLSGSPLFLADCICIHHAPGISIVIPFSLAFSNVSWESLETYLAAHPCALQLHSSCYSVQCLYSLTIVFSILHISTWFICVTFPYVLYIATLFHYLTEYSHYVYILGPSLSVILLQWVCFSTCFLFTGCTLWASSHFSLGVCASPSQSSHLEALSPPRRHVAMSGATSGCYNWVKGE